MATHQCVGITSRRKRCRQKVKQPGAVCGLCSTRPSDTLTSIFAPAAPTGAAPIDQLAHAKQLYNLVSAGAELAPDELDALAAAPNKLPPNFFQLYHHPLPGTFTRSVLNHITGGEMTPTKAARLVDIVQGGRSSWHQRQELVAQLPHIHDALGRAACSSIDKRTIDNVTALLGELPPYDPDTDRQLADRLLAIPPERCRYAALRAVQWMAHGHDRSGITPFVWDDNPHMLALAQHEDPAIRTMFVSALATEPGGNDPSNWDSDRYQTSGAGRLVHTQAARRFIHARVPKPAPHHAAAYRLMHNDPSVPVRQMVSLFRAVSCYQAAADRSAPDLEWGQPLDSDTTSVPWWTDIDAALILDPDENVRNIWARYLPRGLSATGPLPDSVVTAGVRDGVWSGDMTATLVERRCIDAARWADTLNRHPSAAVRAATLEQHAPTSALLTACYDPQRTVRTAALAALLGEVEYGNRPRSSGPPPIELAVLAADPQPQIAKRAQTALDQEWFGPGTLSEDMLTPWVGGARWQSHATLRMVGAAVSTRPDVLAQLARDRSVRVRRRLAERDDLDVAVWLRLSNDSDQTVRDRAFQALAQV